MLSVSKVLTSLFLEEATPLLRLTRPNVVMNALMETTSMEDLMPLAQKPIWDPQS